MSKQSNSEIAETHREMTGDSPCEVVLRVNNLQPMKNFYRDFLGFELLGEFPSAALLRASVRLGAQIQMLGLLQRAGGEEPGHNTHQHIAFTLPVVDHELEKKRLENLGLKVDAIKDEGQGKQSLRFSDPEGNKVELLCP
jgi:catechol-2,3-dioxygenase